MRFLKILLALCLVVVMADVSMSRTVIRYLGGTINVDYDVNPLSQHSTTYALAPATGTIKQVQSREWRARGAYVVNLSTIGFYITAVNYGAGDGAKVDIRANGTYVEGIKIGAGTGIQATSSDQSEQNRFYFLTNETYYILCADIVDYTGTLDLRVYDVWHVFEGSE